MAVQSFYISVEISEKDKNTITSQINLKRYKKSNDLIYKDVLFVDNVTAGGSWWHINAGLYDFFRSCEILYEFCQVIEIIKPHFDFYLLGQKYEFKFQSLMDFVQFVYPKIKNKKKSFENSYGALSISPEKFFSFKRRNKRFFR